MEKKYLKILTTTLSLGLLTPIASCAIGSQEPKTIKSIQIVSDLNNLRLEVNEQYKSNPIEIKCFDNNGNQIRADTKLTLIQLSTTTTDINLVDNQIIIGSNKVVGNYKYQLLATNIDNTVVSEPKEFNVDVYKKEPDSIELKGNNTTQFYYPDSKTIDYQIIAKNKQEIIEDYKGEYNYQLSIKSSSTKLEKDLFNNPLFYLTQIDNQLILHISQNIDNAYQGKYMLEINISLRHNPSVYAIKTIELDLINGIEYVDKSSISFYKRNDVNSTWDITTISSDKNILETDKLLDQIYGFDVSRIGNNFCTLSNIKKMVLIKVGNKVKSIGDYAFDGQEALTSLYIEDVEEVGDYAFNNCKIAMINPQWHFKFKSIGKYAFNGCYKFEGKYFDDIEYLAEGCFKQTAISEIHLGENLKVIGAECLANCSNLQNIYISATKPPQLLGAMIAGSTPSNCKIHVPINALETYRNNPNWMIYQENLVGDITM